MMQRAPAGAVRLHFPYVIREETVWIFSYSCLRNVGQSHQTSTAQKRRAAAERHWIWCIQRFCWLELYSGAMGAFTLGQRETPFPRSLNFQHSAHPVLMAEGLERCGSTGSTVQKAQAVENLKCRCLCHPLQLLILGHWCRKHGG